MATFERSGLTVVTSVEELAAGRYRGFLTIDTEAGQWRHNCLKSRVTPLQARADADGELECALRRFLSVSLAECHMISVR